MASAAKKRKTTQLPQVHIDIIGSDKALNNVTIDHLKLQMQLNGNTVSIMSDPCENVDIPELIKGQNVNKSIRTLTEIWEELREQKEEKNYCDFVIFRQSLESLKSFSSILGTRAKDEKSFYLIRRLYRREMEACEADEKMENDEKIFRIKLYIFDNENESENPEEKTLNAVLNYACRTETHNRIFHYFNHSPGGDIWSRICGMIQAEPDFCDLLYNWQFNEELCESTRQNAEAAKRKRFFDNARAVANYTKSSFKPN